MWLCILRKCVLRSGNESSHEARSWARGLHACACAGQVPPRQDCMLSASGVHYTFCRQGSGAPAGPPHGSAAKPRAVSALPSLNARDSLFAASFVQHPVAEPWRLHRV